MLQTLFGVLAGGGLLSALVAIYQARAQKRATEAGTSASEAEAGETLVKTAVMLVIPLGERVTRLEAEHKECEERASELEARIAALEGS